MDVLQHIAEMTERDYVPQVIIGRIKVSDEEFHSVSVNKIPLKSSGNIDNPDYNWGYSGKEPFLLANSLVLEVFKLYPNDKNICGKLYIFGAAAKFIERCFLKHLNKDKNFELTDVEIAKKLYPFLLMKLREAMIDQ